MQVYFLNAALLSFVLISVVASSKLVAARDAFFKVNGDTSPNSILLDATTNFPSRPLAIDSMLHSTQPLFRLQKRAPMDEPKEHFTHHDAIKQVDESTSHHDREAAKEDEIRQAWQKVDHHNNRYIKLINTGGNTDQIAEEEGKMNLANAKHQALKFGNADAAKVVEEHYNDKATNFLMHVMNGVYTPNHPAVPILDKWASKAVRWNKIHSRLVDAKKKGSSQSHLQSEHQLEVDDEGSSSNFGPSDHLQNLQIDNPDATHDARLSEDISTAAKKMDSSLKQLKAASIFGDQNMYQRAFDKYYLSQAKFSALLRNQPSALDRVVLHYESKAKEAKRLMEESFGKDNHLQRVAYFNEQDKKLDHWRGIRKQARDQMRQNRTRRLKDGQDKVNLAAKRTGNGEHLPK